MKIKTYALLFVCMLFVPLALLYKPVQHWRHDRQFYSAADEGDISTLQRLLDAGIGREFDDYEGMPQIDIALLNAAFMGRTDAVRFLLSQGANVNPHNTGFGTALTSAVEEGHVDTVKFLLTQGADVNLPRANGGTALILAASHGSDELMQVLLAHHANVNVKDENGKTALWYAWTGGHDHVVHLLKQAGATE